MNRTLFLSILLSAFTLNAAGMISPAYRSLSMIDAAVDALAQGGKTGLVRKQTGDVTVHSASMTQNKTTNADVISIDVGNLICAVTIAEHQPPAGISGAPSYSGKVSGCSKYLTIRAVDVMKYEELRIKLNESAGKGIKISNLIVVGSPQGPVVKINNKN